MYNGGVGAVGSAKKDDPAAGADVREEVLEERVKFGHAAIIQEGRRVVIRNPQGRASASGVGMFGAECRVGGVDSTPRWWGHGPSIARPGTVPNDFSACFEAAP